MKHNSIRAAGVLVAAAATAAGFVAAPGTAGADPNPACPVVFALGVQGTGQSSPGASATDDTGFLSQVFVPVSAQAGSAGVAISHEYIAYDASFGGYGSTGGSGVTYDQSVTGGVQRLETRMGEITSQCPNTRLALAGYSQGAHVVSLEAQKIGSGGGAVPADKVVAVALFGDPNRSPAAGVFPGTIDQKPATVPGTSGEAISALDTVNEKAASGSGIGTAISNISASTDDSGGSTTTTAVAKPESFGKLIGRVASFCTSGDLACDAPDNAALLRTVAEVASQVDHGGDPLAAISSITNALSMTAIKTATNVINQDISGTSLANLSISPKKSISARLAEAADPTTSLDPAQVVKALVKVGTIGLNAVVTVAKSLLTPSNIAEIGAAGLADPVAGLATFGAKLASAVVDLIPPATGVKLITQAFTAIGQNLIDNADLLKAETWVKYSDVITKHGSYLTDPVTGSGQTAVAWVASWITAAARDLSGSGAAQPSSSVTPTSVRPAALTSAIPTPTTVSRTR